jgi:hypothetical protein
MLRFFCVLVTETAADLTQSLKKAKAENMSVEKRRLKTLQNIVSFADFVQKEGNFFIGFWVGAGVPGKV